MSSGLSSTSNGLASLKTLYNWRRIFDLQTVHKNWFCYSSLLSEHGIELFKYGSFKGEHLPPDGVCRSSEEAGVYRLHEPEFTVPTTPEGRFWRRDDTRVAQDSALVHPARDSTGRWLMLRIVRLGTDGAQHVDILRLLSNYPNRADSRNHCLPMIREIQTVDITIAVLPFMMGDQGLVPPFYSLREALEFVIQTMEGLAFLHNNLIAHRDIGYENIVWNLAGPCQTPEEQERNLPTPWRSKFPIRYFFIDFEHAVHFDKGSDPATCVVQGFISKRFARFSPPECLGDVPFSPFAADVFSLGLVYWAEFRQVSEPGFMPLVEQLLAPLPSLRPTAADALCAFHAYREHLSGSTLAQIVPPRMWKEGETHMNAVMPEPLARSLGLHTKPTSL